MPSRDPAGLPVSPVSSDEALYFNGLGERFETWMSDYDVERRAELIFTRLLHPNQVHSRRVLEVGCGTGRFSKRLFALGAELTVLDIGPQLVEQVRHQLGCRGVVGDATRLPLPDDTFDLVVSSECIEHTPDPLAAVREMCRVCRPGGWVCLTTPNRLWWPVLVLAHRLGLRRFAGPEHWVWPGQIARTLRQAGMTDIRLDGCHLWPFQLRFTRPLLRRLDRLGRRLWPVMINFGIVARRPPTASATAPVNASSRIPETNRPNPDYKT